jgi:hypothetical protein
VKKIIVGVIVLSVSMLLMQTAQAQAVTIRRDGSDYNGYANPGGCRILVHDDLPTVLHVNCKDATAPARIRYRYLKSLDVVHSWARFTGDIEKRGGTGDISEIKWLCEPDGPRTGRIIVPVGLYVHINTVTWKLRRID